MGFTFLTIFLVLCYQYLSHLPFTVTGVLKAIQNSKDTIMVIQNLVALVCSLLYECVKTDNSFNAFVSPLA